MPASAARHYLYRFFQFLFGNEPKAEAWGELDSELFGEACEIVGVNGRALGGKLCEAQTDAAIRKHLSVEYTVAFIGPGALASPPWESAQLSGDGALFSAITLDVRNAYREQGLLPEQYPRVADDHIALECGFLAELAERALSDFQVFDGERCRENLATSKVFLDAHPLRWVDVFAGKIDGGRTPFYQTAAQVLADFMHIDTAWLSARSTR